MKPCYINSVGSVSTQNTLDNSQFLNEIVNYDSNVIEIIKPNYKEYMQGASARRMAKGVKMGIVASTIALKKAKVDNPDAIITGTGMGCVIDSEKFVSAMIDNDEQFLTPTSFIQSTHNTVGGQVALNLKCKSYNFSYVNGAISFESCLIDGQLMLEEGNAKNILIGGIDELAPHTVAIHKVNDFIKKEEHIGTTEILNSGTKGAVFGEGASFFVLSKNAEKNSYAKLLDTSVFAKIKKKEVVNKIADFLKKNNTQIEDIDAIILGKNGDAEYDIYYENVENTFKNTSQIVYKHLSGEYFTASSFGFLIACNLLKNQELPKELFLNSTEKNIYQKVLLFNQYRGKDFGFVLLEKC
ncbi:MAG: 3-oxoacyl-ACP synthase [Bacteroidetes bacterium]|nr:MAG: 3-oxoacyl-ACP synthase [Bacteroidota bacterium]